MSRRTTIALVAPLVAALGLALAGCGAGKDAQVVKEHTAINGVNVNLAGGIIQVRNVYATPVDTALTQVPAGGSLALHFHVYNNGAQPELMVASSPASLSGPGAACLVAIYTGHTAQRQTQNLAFSTDRAPRYGTNF